MSPLPTSTKVWLLAEPPTKDVTPSTFLLTTKALPSPLPANSVLVQTLYLSNDPAQRGWIQKDVSAHRLYREPVRAGSIMAAGGLGKVVASSSDLWKEGDLVTARGGWAEYFVAGEKEVQALPEGLPSPTVALGIVGGTGMTAWFGLHEVGLVKKEHTVVISGAAGATGSTAIQIAKNIIGCKKVVGIAGGKAKCDYVKSLGADDCVDYKSATFEADLEKATEDEVDVYFDNVGGEVLNAMLPRIRRFGRIIACGSIASYNDVSKSVIPNWFEVISNRITIQGFLVFDFPSKIPEAKEALAAGVKTGKIKTTGNHETIREGTFEQIPEIWQELFVGKNTGKLITKLV